MSSKGPTDFNDQAAQQSGLSIADQVNTELTAMAAARKQGVDASAQPHDNQKPPPSEKDAPRDDETVWQDSFESGRDGPKATVRNITLVLQHDKGWRDVIGYCDFSYRVMKRKTPPMPNTEAGEWDDGDTASFRVWTAHQYGFTPSHGDIADALMVVGKENRFHPVRDYLEALEWDGTPRLDSWLKEALGSSDAEEYQELVGPSFLIGAVARVMSPGCKMDNVMILEGPQGRGKSTIVDILFGQWFSDAQLPIGDKDAYQVIQGKWGFELAELDSFNKSETTTLKQFFSQRIDRFRPSYGRHAADFPRQTVFMGTTNQDAYLRDYTGNRRFWPVFCAALNKDWVRENRDQLWAEAAKRYQDGEQWWIDSEHLPIVEEAQDARLQRDAWEDLLRDYLDGVTREWLSSADVLKEAIGLDGGHIQQMHMNRLGPIMKVLGWKSKRMRVKEQSNSSAKPSQRRVWVKAQQDEGYDDVPI